MEWLRVLMMFTVLGLVGCANPSGPKYPDPGEEEDPAPTEPGPNQGFHHELAEQVTFFA